MSNDEICATCFGTGNEVMSDNRGTRPCPTCQPARIAARQRILFERIPTRYQGVTLEGLTPRPDLHRDQAKVIEWMKRHPDGNYYFCGENDTGKTHFLWALYQHAVISNRNVIATTLHDWIEANVSAFRDNNVIANTTFRLADIQQSKYPYSVFIDDADKKKVSEYVADMVFNFVDSIYRYKHQLVVTSQLDPEKRINGRESLVDHFRDGDPRYGVGIARRLVNDETAIWRMF